MKVTLEFASKNAAESAKIAKRLEGLKEINGMKVTSVEIQEEEPEGPPSIQKTHKWIEW